MMYLGRSQATQKPERIVRGARQQVDIAHRIPSLVSRTQGQSGNQSKRVHKPMEMRGSIKINRGIGPKQKLKTQT
jgi:hypothetical protein